MNKIIIYLLLGSTFILNAQQEELDSVAMEVFEPATVADTAAVAAIPAVHTYKERAFDSKFKEKYTDSEFIYEMQTKGKSDWDRFWDSVRRFFDNLFSFGSKKTTLTAIDIFMKIAVLLIILAVVYFIVRILLKKEGQWIFGRSAKKIVAHDTEDENIHQMDFSQLIGQTLQDENYRLAVRYYYLWLLKKLSYNEMIDWHWDKTNSDYLYEIKSDTLRKDFEYLSYLYDYSWYGEFPLDKISFTKAQKAFLKTLNTL